MKLTIDFSRTGIKKSEVMRSFKYAFADVTKEYCGTPDNRSREQKLLLDLRDTALSAMEAVIDYVASTEGKSDETNG